VAVTPFQIAQMMSIVANGGYIYSPSLLMVENKPAPLTKLTIRQETFDEVKKALLGVVNENGGTGWAAKSSVVNIGGKTGTAQVVGMKRDSKYLPELLRDHAWFVAFAPYETPQIALSVMVEHGGHGGAAASPIVKRTIETYMKGQRLENRQTAP